MGRKVKFLILILIVAVIIPIVLELVVFRNRIYSSVSNEGWAGFLGGYIGALIGAFTTYITVNLEIKNNEKVRQEDLKMEFRPYLYFRVDEIDEDKRIVYTFLSNFGKYAACDIKGYIVKNESKILKWDQHFCLGGNQEFRIFVPLLKDDEYYIYECKDVLGRKYEQTVRKSGINENGLFDFYAEPPVLIE